MWMLTTPEHRDRRLGGADGYRGQVSLPHLALSADPHDRAGVRRTDPAWLDQRWADPTSRVLVVAGARVRLDGDRVEWLPPGQAPEGVRVLLGDRDGITRFALLVEDDAAVTTQDESHWVGLRGLLGPLAEGRVPDVPLVLHAIGLAEWHAATRHCPRCGGHLAPRAAGHELRCEACGRRQFPRTDPAVIMLVSDGDPGAEGERCLLGRQSAWPERRYSTLAGFCEPGETLEDAVRREVAEETGIVVGEVTYFGNQPWPLPASLMLGFLARAESTEIRVDEDEIEDAVWVTRSELRLQAEAGTLVLPGGFSISRSLIEHWYGGPLPGHWS